MPWTHSFLAKHMRRVAIDPCPRDPDLPLPCRSGQETIDDQPLTPAKFYAQAGRRGLPGGNPDDPAGAPYFVPQPVYRFCVDPTKVVEAERDVPRDLAAILAHVLAARGDGKGSPLPLLITGTTGSGKSIALGEAFHWMAHPGGPSDSWWQGSLERVDRGTNIAPRDARKSLGNHPFVRIDPADIQIRMDDNDILPRLATAIARAATADRTIGPDMVATKRYAEWIRWSPPALLVFDLNRGEQDCALRLAQAALDLAKGALSQHRFVFIYRRQSAHTGDDKVWGLLDPDERKSEAWELRALGMEEAAEYVHVVRRGSYLRRHGFAAALSGEKAILDAKAFRGLKDRFESHIGLPLLVYFVSLVDTVQDIQSVSQLYDRVVARFFGEEIGKSVPGSRTATENEMKRVFYLCHVAAVEMARGKDDLSLDPERLSAQEAGEEVLREQLPEYTEDLWNEHLGDGYRKVAGDRKRGRELLLKHSLLTQVSQSELRWIHDSFSYYFSARAFRFAESPGFPAGAEPSITRTAGVPPSPDSAFLARLARIMTADPKLWYLRAEFLAGWLDPASLHALIFEHMLGERAAGGGAALFDQVDEVGFEAQLKALPLLERLSAGLCAPADSSEAARDVARCGYMLEPLTLLQKHVREKYQLRWSPIPRGPIPDSLRRAKDPPPPRVTSCREEPWGAVEKRVGKDRRFQLLRLRSQASLHPLGPDPGSRLEEFAVDGTGELPWRDQEGHVIASEESAIVLVLVPGAKRARVGSPEGAAGRWGNETEHDVSLEPFFVSKFPVTQEQWARVLRDTEAEARRRGEIRYSPHFFLGPVLPVESVSYEDCQAFCVEMNSRLELVAGLDLPKEAQWEHACRAGDHRYAPYFGADGGSDDLRTLRSLGWFIGNSRFRAHRVGLKGPNPWGLHDLHGNVLEWCKDLYEPGSAYRVLRGGSWVYDARNCRSAFRVAYAPRKRGNVAGFRPVLPLAAE